jgi:hypothetical protein
MDSQKLRKTAASDFGIGIKFLFWDCENGGNWDESYPYHHLNFLASVVIVAR